MKKEDIDKLERSLNDGIEIWEDVEKAKEDDGVIDWGEKGMIFVKHGHKGLRFAGSLKELADEVIDLDGTEAQLLAEKFGNSAEAKEAIGLIANGAGDINQGIQKLIALKKQ